MEEDDDTYSSMRTHQVQCLSSFGQIRSFDTVLASLRIRVRTSGPKQQQFAAPAAPYMFPQATTTVYAY